MGLRLIALFLLLLVCLELAAAGRRGGRGHWKKGKKFGGPRRGGEHYGRKDWRRPKFLMKPHRPFKGRQLNSSWETRLKLHFGCERLTAITSSVNESLHHRRQKLHRMFTSLLKHAQSHRGGSPHRRRNMKSVLRYELDKIVEHQCQNAIRMVNLLKQCNESRLDSFESTWHRQYHGVYAKLKVLGGKRGKKVNVSELCSKASAKPSGYRRRRFPQHVRHVCQRLELLKCIFGHQNITLPTIPDKTRHPHPRFMGKYHPKKNYSPVSQTSSSSDDDDYDGHRDGKRRHGKLHKHGKLLFGVGALLLLVLAAILLVCFLRYRKKLQSRDKNIEKLETVAKENHDTWTTPPDSTVAWLQAKGWRNPVYYALEEEAMKTQKVAI